MSSPSSAGNYTEIAWESGGAFFKLDHSVIDGSDSSGASTAYTGSGKALGICSDLEYNVIRYVSNGCVDGASSGYPADNYHDNLFEYMYNPAGGHGNVIELGGGSGGPSPGNIYFYNNVMRHTDEGVGFDLIPANGSSIYAFNNVFYDNANASNCFGPGAPNGATATSNVYFYNNTVDSQPNVQGNNNGGCVFGVANSSHVVMHFANNHMVNYSSTNFSANVNWSGGTGTINDIGNEVWQGECTANSQSYLGVTTMNGSGCQAGDNGYSPQNSSGQTYHAGANLSTLCSTFSYDSALCSGTSFGVSEVEGSGGYVVNYPAVPVNPRGTAWDAGAYQFTSSSTQLNPPSGLSAVVQ